MKNIKKKIAAVLAFVMAFSTISLFTAYAAQEPAVPIYPVEEFFALPQEFGFIVTPDGENLYFRAPVNNIINLFRREIATGEDTRLTFEENQHIQAFFLKGDTVFFTRDYLGNENTHIFRVEEDGSATNITPYPNAMFIVISTLEDTDADEEIMIFSNKENPTVFNTYRLNVFTGEFTLIMPAVDGIIMDNDGTIRWIVQSDGANSIILHRHTDDDEFELAGVVGHRDVLFPAAFDTNNEYVYVFTNIDREFITLVRMNPANLEIAEVIFEHDRVDLAGALGSFTPGVLGGVIYFDDFVNFVFFDEESEAFYNQVSAHFPENVVAGITSISEDHNIAVVTVSSDVNQGQSYLFNRAENTLTRLADFNNVNPDHMAPMIPISYTARDGKTIPGYLILPVGVEPYNLPVVMYVHGGPWARVTWGFNAQYQFLANRGYAVFIPNFRGGTGYGRTFLESGYGEWGLSMQDDLTDGIAWLIEEGIADPSRIAIFGASYGGYAALAGAAFTPDLFAAVISYIGISSLFTLLDSLPPQWEAQREMFYDRVGHPERDFERLRATSPLYHAENITAPLLIGHGANDVRTTLIESTQIVDALEARDVDVEFVIFWDEGHSLMHQHNVITLFTMMEAFLAEHLGGRTLTTLADLAELSSPYVSPASDELFVEVAEGIFVFLGALPLNIDGYQGQIMQQSPIAQEHVGEFAVVFDTFSGGMTVVNAAVVINGNDVALGMNLQPGDYLVFSINPEDVGQSVSIRMSTNGPNVGTVRISILEY